MNPARCLLDHLRLSTSSPQNQSLTGISCAPTSSPQRATDSFHPEIMPSAWYWRFLLKQFQDLMANRDPTNPCLEPSTTLHYDSSTHHSYVTLIEINWGAVRVDRQPLNVVTGPKILESGLGAYFSHIRARVEKCREFALLHSCQQPHPPPHRRPHRLHLFHVTLAVEPQFLNLAPDQEK